MIRIDIEFMQFPAKSVTDLQNVVVIVPAASLNHSGIHVSLATRTIHISLPR